MTAHPVDGSVASQWVRRWDLQQEFYAEYREARFAAMIDLLCEATLDQTEPVVIDIGSGPGSLAARVADRLPHARIVAVESDPFLVALGRAWRGDAVQFEVETAGAPGWRARLGFSTVHAVVASSALHYPPVARLRTLYGEIFEWLAPHGILLNADHFPDLGEPTNTADLGPWTRWWQDATASAHLAPLLAPLLALGHSTAAPADSERSEGDNSLTAIEHISLLRGAGFGRAELAWRCGRSGVVAARV